MSAKRVYLCPGQGAQAVGMGKAWAESSSAARAVFEEADRVLGDSLGAPLSAICFDGPAERLNQTDVSQPAIYTCSIACHRGLVESGADAPMFATAGLSLGEYSALCLAGAFSFADGLTCVAARGRLMQDAAEASDGSMVALIGADDAQAQEVCDEATSGGGVLVCANFNAPGQIVLSGDSESCTRAVAVAEEKGLRATQLTVAGAFHSPLMQPAADAMADVLAKTPFSTLQTPVWSNVTAEPHESDNMELLRSRLVEQIVSPVKWAQSCAGLIQAAESEVESAEVESGRPIEYHELAPGNVLRGLMRRIERKTKVINHDTPESIAN